MITIEEKCTIAWLQGQTPLSLAGRKIEEPEPIAVKALLIKLASSGQLSKLLDGPAGATFSSNCAVALRKLAEEKPVKIAIISGDKKGSILV